jgi:D-alanyl-D-alanine carboxypeptidase
LTSTSYEHAFLANPESHWNDVKLLTLAMQEKFSTPGKFNYTNTDYILAGLVIESVTSRPLAYSIQSILHKAGIYDAYFPASNSTPPSYISNQIATGYMPENPYWPPLLMKVFRRYPKAFIEGRGDGLAYDVTRVELAQLSVAPAAGGLVMHVPAMVKWFGNLFIKKTILNSDSLNEMLGSVKTDQNDRYGLGISVNQLPAVHMTIYNHTGSTFGYNTNLLYIKDSNIIIAVAINAQRDTLRFKEGLIEILIKYLSIK